MDLWILLLTFMGKLVQGVTLALQWKESVTNWCNICISDKLRHIA